MNDPIRGKTWKQLEGVWLDAPGIALRFEESNSFLPASYKGGEGYAVALEEYAQPGHGQPPSPPIARHILKTFFLPGAERNARVTFLTGLRLAELMPVFAAAPARSVSGNATPREAVKPVHIEGYIAPYLPGKRLDSLWEEGWDPPREARIRLAAQLIEAVRILEAGSIAHADLSPGNILVLETTSSNPHLRLIDFDGFHHPKIANVPVSSEMGGRCFGTKGYRHKAFKLKDESVIVSSDRLAMAALIFELIALRAGELEELGRGHLLDQDDLDEGLVKAPANIISRWPEGWALVSEAAARSPEGAPSPARWFTALQQLARCEDVASMTPRPPGRRTALTMPPPAGTIILRIDRIDQPERRVRLTQSTNSFATVDSRLRWLRYVKTEDRVELVGVTDTPVFHRRLGKIVRHTGQLSIYIQAGDEIRWDDFTIEVDQIN